MLIDINMMGTEPIRQELVKESVKLFKEIIDKDDIEQGSSIIQDRWSKLTNDERMACQNLMKDKAPDSGPKGQMYKIILSKYIKYR